MHRSLSAVGVGGRGRGLSCQQPGSSFHLTNGRDPKGYILRDGQETPAKNSCLALLCVCTVVGLGGEFSQFKDVQEPAPGCSGHLEAGRCLAPRHLEWVLGCAHPRAWPRFQEEPHWGPRWRVPPGSPWCAAKWPLSATCRSPWETSGFLGTGSCRLSPGKRRGRGRGGAQAVPEPAGRVDGESCLSSALCSESWKPRGPARPPTLGL